MAFNTGGMTVGLPRMTRTVAWLVGINVAAYIVQQFADATMIGLFGLSSGTFWQPWRYVTFQFLHGGNMHILLNMLGLWFLGSPLEEAWGRRRFLFFYFTCGIFAGVAYVIVSLLARLPSSVPIIGASGGVYGIVLACAVLFPQMQLIFLFFPVPIRLAAAIVFGGMILLVAQSLGRGEMSAAMSDVAHLGGAGMAAIWLKYSSVLDRITQRRWRPRTENWEKKARRERKETEELDRILEKISRKGMASLSIFEKWQLKRMSRKK